MMRASSSSSEGSASRNTRSAGMLEVMSRVSGHEVTERELKSGRRVFGHQRVVWPAAIDTCD